MGDSILLSYKWSQAPCPAGCLAWRCSEAVQNLSISLQRGPAHSCSENNQEQPSLSKDGQSPFLFSLDSKGKPSRCPDNSKAHQRAAALPPDSLCSRLLGQTPTRGGENLGPGLLQTLNSAGAQSGIWEGGWLTPSCWPHPLPCCLLPPLSQRLRVSGFLAGNLSPRSQVLLVFH